MTDFAETQDDWPVRAAALALAGAGIAVALHFLLQGAKPYSLTEDAGRLAFAAFLAIGGIAFGFVVERTGQLLSLGFAFVMGAMVAGAVYWSNIGSGWDGGEGWRLACGLLTVAIAAPLFQAWRGARGGTPRLPYAAAHNHAWTDVVLWFSSWVFVGIALGLAFLLSGLFDLIGLDFLRQLLDKPWFYKMLVGAAFGGAVGLLRDRERVLGTLQRVVTTVLSVLAPVLALGLLVFLAALPFTGLAPLWAATKSTTPILLASIAGALILANAVIGDAPEDETRQRALRWAAMALGVTILPLAVIAAVSTSSRIVQYGLTPDRLWATVFTGVASAYGLAYLVVLLRYRAGWTAPLRAANLNLALGLCGLAFVLSTPLVSFGAISTRDQVARLESGRTPPGRFDWSALRFDFGPAGKAAVEHQSKFGRRPDVRAAAAAALKADTPWKLREKVDRMNSAPGLDQRLVIVPKPVPLPADLRKRLTNSDACGLRGACAIIYAPDANEVFVAHVWANSRANAEPADALVPGNVDTSRLTRTAAGWTDDDAVVRQTSTSEDAKRVQARQAERVRQLEAIRRGSVEVRDVVRRQVFIDGRPVGGVFEAQAADGSEK